MSHVSAVFACAMLLALELPVAIGQTTLPGNQVQQTALERPGDAKPQRSVTFARREACVGDRVEQKMTLQIRMNTSTRQGNQLVKKNGTAIRSFQHRDIATTHVDQGRTTAVEVHYLDATKQIGPTQPPPQASASPASPPVAQVVKGKTYRCRRERGEDSKLIITDAAGQTPPSNEYEIVAKNMEMVGRSNPLAQYLASRTVAIGDVIALPKDVAGELFQLGRQYGDVTRFDLTLQRTSTEGGVRCATFLAAVDAASNDSSQMRLQVEGPLVVEIASCRVVRMSFSGPIAFSETRGSYSMAQQLIGTGQLKMSIASAYRDAQR